MKIFEIEFENIKYSGESNRQIVISARSIIEAERLAVKVLGKRDDIYGKSYWVIIRVEKIAETEN